MAAGRFDAAAFWSALDAQRQGRELTWRRVAGESGVSASTLTRLAQGKRPDVDSLAALLKWSGLTAEAFIRSEGSGPGQPEPLAMISTLLRADKHLSPESAVALEELIKATYARLRKA